jgi:hypothetical protein
MIDWACRDCGASTHAERYIVKDETWRQSALDYRSGMLCVGCLEARLGRKLARGDFIFTPLNIEALWFGSERLRDRLDAGGILKTLRHKYGIAQLPLPINDRFRVITCEEALTGRCRMGSTPREDG